MFSPKIRTVDPAIVSSVSRRGALQRPAAQVRRHGRVARDRLRLLASSVKSMRGRRAFRPAVKADP